MVQDVYKIMVSFAITVVLAGAALVAAVVFAAGLPVCFRFGSVGLLVGIVIGFPVAFLLVFFRLYDQQVVVNGVYVSHTVWLPLLTAAMGSIGGVMIGLIKK